ncbi:MAG: SDR family NAD(P)-dependent oxidoreductase [Spirochaetota bacterium]
MIGRTIVITGGGRGLGRLMCQEAARRDALVVVAARDRCRSAQAAGVLATEATCPAPEALVVDLASASPILAAGAESVTRFGRIDALVKNAGQMNYEGRTSPDGIELSIATNYLGAVRFTEALRPAMGRGSRIVNVSSSSAMLAGL